MAKIKATHTSQESQTQKVLNLALQLTAKERDDLLLSLVFYEPASERHKLHVGHLLEAEAFGTCSEFPKLSLSEIRKRVFANPTQKRLYRQSKKAMRENLAGIH